MLEVSGLLYCYLSASVSTKFRLYLT